MVIKMPKGILQIAYVFALTITICISCRSADGLISKLDWNEYRSDHFIIHYHPGIPNKYIREFTQRCETYYHIITERLGFERFNFWLWENRASIFIYKDKQDYLQDSAQPEWSAAAVQVHRKFINTFYFEEKFFDLVLPHELTHIILREFITADARVPLWFEEGLACANEKDSRSRYLLFTRGAVKGQTYLSVPQMEAMGRPGTDSPNLFYATAGSLIIFLLEEYQKQDFIQLCRELRDGASFYGAMQKVYGITDGADLNQKFLTFLEK